MPDPQALAAAAGIAGLSGAAVFSIGSDGTDGPTDAAGGYVDGGTVRNAIRSGFSPAWIELTCKPEGYVDEINNDTFGGM